MSKLIKEESGIQFIFKGNTTTFQLERLLDKEGNKLSIIQFLDQYEKYDELNELLSSENKMIEENHDEIIVKSKKIEKWKFQNPSEIEEIIRKR